MLGSGFKNSSKIYELVFTFLSLDQAGEKVKAMRVIIHLNDDEQGMFDNSVNAVKALNEVVKRVE